MSTPLISVRSPLSLNNSSDSSRTWRSNEGKYNETELAFQRPASPIIILSTPEKLPRHNASSSNSDSDVVFVKENKRSLDILHSPGYRNEKRQKDKEHKDEGLPWLSKKKQRKVPEHKRQ
jgi:hypothetical protein